MVVLGAGPAGEVCAGRLAEAASRSRWSSATSWAASARTTRACPRRRCCAPRRRSPRRAACRARPQGSTGALDVAAVLARRDEIVSDLDDAAQLPWLEGAGSSSSAATGGSRASARCASASELLTRAGGRARAGSARGPAADPRARRGRAVDQPRGHDRGAVPGVAARARRGRRRGRDGPGLRLARRRGDLIEALERLIAARGGVRVRAAARGARRARRRGRARRRVSASARDAGGRSRSSSRTARSSPPRSCSWPSGRRPRTDDLGLEAVGLEPGGPSRSTTRCGARARLAVRRRRRQRAGRCSPTWASTRRASPATILGARAAALGDGAVAACDLHRTAGRGGRAHARQARERGHRCARLDVDIEGNAGAKLHRARRTGDAARIVDRRAIAACSSARRSPARGRRVAARCDDRGGRRGAGRAACGSGAGFPTRSEVWLNLLEPQAGRIERAQGAREISRRAA